MKSALLWPLWSPRRLGLTAVALVAVLGILGACAGTGHPKPTHMAPTGTTTSQIPDPIDHSADVSTATSFVTVWLSHTPAAVWLPSVQALTTPAMGAGFAGVDPATIPGTKVTTPGVWSPAGVTVGTNAGSVIVTLNPSGKVSDIEPTSAPSAAMGR